MRTEGWAISASPVDTGPVRTLNTLSGRPRVASSASMRLVSGVSSLGLSTTVLPAAMAGNIFHIAICRGSSTGDRADDADGFAPDRGGVVAIPLRRRTALQVAGGSGEKQRVVDGSGDIEARRQADGFACLAGLDPGVLVGPLGHPTAQRQQRVTAHDGEPGTTRQMRPGSRHRRLDVGRTGQIGVSMMTPLDGSMTSID